MFYNATISKAKHENNEEGFTLIELLVVILIIGILSAIAVPAFLNQRKEAADAALKSDLRTVVLQMQTYFIGHDLDDLLNANGGENDIVWHAEGVDKYGADMNRWNDIFPDRKVEVSEGTYIHAQIHGSDTGIWDAHERSAFCLAGGNTGGNYDYPGGDAALYNTMLYFDVKAGGVATMEQLVERKQAGQEVSCSGWVNRYMLALGL